MALKVQKTNHQKSPDKSGQNQEMKGSPATGQCQDAKHVKGSRKEKFWAFMEGAINGNPNRSWVNVSALIVNLLALAAYRSMGPALAEFQGTKTVYNLSIAATVLFLLILIWEGICLIGYKNFRKCAGHVFSHLKSLWKIIKERRFNMRAALFAGGCLTALLVILYFGFHTTKYYASVVEIYGIPTGVGDPLEPEEKNNCAGYWKISNYPLRRYMVLDYQEAYGQMEIMRQYSTAYSMPLFQASDRIEIKYERKRKKYSSLRDQDSFLSARKNHFREPVKVSYYSNRKLVLELCRNEQDKFEIAVYSAEDTPQLLNSTLLRIPKGEEAGYGITSQQIEVTYNSDGLPEKRRISSGISNLYGINGECYQYDENRRLKELCYLGIDGEPVCNKLGIMVIDFSYEEESGNLHSIRYYSDQQKTEKTEGFYGVFCEKFEYDPYGNVILREQLGRDENWWYDDDNVYRYEYTYEAGALVREAYFNFDDSPAWNERIDNNLLCFKKKKDDQGNWMIVVSYNDFQEDEEASESFGGLESIGDVMSGLSDFFAGKDTSPGGLANQTGPLGTTEAVMDVFSESVADNRKDIPKIVSPDTGLRKNAAKDARPGMTDARSAMQAGPEAEPDSDFVRPYSSVHYSFGRDGTVLEMGYYNGSSPVGGGQGFAFRRFEYDDQFRVTDEAYFGTDGQPCMASGGYGAVRNSYEGDRLVRREYLDSETKLVFNRELGYAYVIYESSGREENGSERIRESYYDQFGKPAYLPDQGYAKKDQFYDKRGFLTRVVYLDEEGKPTCLSELKIAEILYEYGDDGNLIRKWYKGVTGEGVNRLDTGYAVIYQKFQTGRLVEKRYGGYYNGNLTLVPDKETGVAIMRYSYEKGQRVRDEYLDAAGEPVLHNETGCAAREYEYDEKGQICAQYFYGTDGELILRKDTGYAIVRNQYNEFGQHTLEFYYGTDEQPIVSTKYHCAGFRYRYNARRYKEEISYLGPDGELMVRPDLGYAQVKKEYDGQGNQSRGEYLDAAGNPAVYKERGYASYEDTYENGNWIEGKYFGTDGELILRKDTGYAVIRMEYDEFGQRISERYYGVEKEEGTGPEPVISSKYHCVGFQYQYNSKGYRTEVSYIGLNDCLMVREDKGFARCIMDYDKQGNQISEYYFDAKGKPTISTEKGYFGYQETFEKGNWVESRYYGTDGGKVLRKDTGYAVIQKQYDDQGQCTSSLYYDTYEKPVISTKYHCAGFEYHYDERGNTDGVSYIGVNGKRMVRPDMGYAQIHRSYDAEGNLRRESYFDEKGDPAVCLEGGYASCQNIYEKGNWVEGKYFGTDKRLILREDTGYAMIRKQYDQAGRCTLETYWGADQKAVVSSKYNCAGFQYRYDEKGNTAEIRYRDPEGASMQRPAIGYARICREYDDFGNMVKESYFDAFGHPTACSEGGYASCEDIYEDGNRIESRYRDAQGSLVLRKDTGYAVVRLKYNGLGQCVSERYYGTDEKKLEPVISSKYGCAGYDYEYDVSGNKREDWCLGLDGKPMVRRGKGYARISSEYDSLGNKTGESYFDASGNPAVWSEGGYSSYRDVYKDGNWVETRYYDRFGDLAVRKDTGYAVIKNEYNSSGQRISQRYYGTAEQPVISTSEHCAGFEYKYDAAGNRTEIRYIGLNGSLIVRSDLGYAKVCREYDGQGNIVKEDFYDAKGHPAACKEGGYAFRENVYENGNWMESRYYDRDHNLMLRKDTGYAIVQNQYNESGQRISQRYYGADGEKLSPVISTSEHCAGYKYEYDEEGNHVLTQYIGLEGSLMTRDDYGFAQMRFCYDQQGRKISVEYLDMEGNPAIWPAGGFSRYDMVYEKGNQVEERYYDTENNLVLRKDSGYAVVKMEYDAFGQITKKLYCGTDGNPVINTRENCAGYEYEYDERGNNTYIWYCGLSGEREVHESVGAILNWRYFDEDGYMTSSQYYRYKDSELVSVNRKDFGYAFAEDNYMEARLVERVYFDENQNMVMNPETGYAAVSYTYNEAGLLTERSYYDENWELIEGADGYAMIEYEYDAVGNYIAWQKYDRFGNPINN